MASELAVAYISLVPSIKGLKERIREELGDPVEKASEKSGRESGSKFGASFANGVQGALRGGAFIGQIAGMANLAVAGATAAAAVAPVGGALLAIPAAAAVGAVAMATLKTATSGVGDAMAAVADGDAKKLAEATKKLSPAARSFVGAWAGLSKEFKPIQQAVQQQVFVGLDKQLKGLGKATLPALGQAMKGTAGQMNALAGEGIKAASSPAFSGLLADAGKTTANSLGSFKGVIGPLVGALGNLVKVGGSLVERLAQAAGNSARANAQFYSTSAGAAKMSGALDRGVQVFRSLRAITSNVKAGLTGMFDRVGLDSAGFLASIEKLTAKFALWGNSAKGQQQVADLLGVMAAIGERVAEILPQIISAVKFLAGAFDSLPGPVQDLATTFVAWSIVLNPISGLLVKVGMAGLGLIRAVPAIWAFGASLFAADKSTQSFAARMIVAAATTVGSWVAAAARTVASLAVMTAGFVAQGAAMAARAVATAAVVVAGWVMMGVQSLLQAGRMAAAWLIAMGPIGLVIAAVVGLVAVIVANWDKIVSVVTGAAKAVWSVLVGAFNAVVSAARQAWDWVGAKLDWFAAVASRVASNVKGFLGGMWDGLVSGAKSAANFAISIINGLISGANFAIKGLNLIPGVNIGMIPQIPKLAKGGVTQGPTVAMIGEGREQEAVLPLSKLDAMLNTREFDPTRDGQVSADDFERAMRRALTGAKIEIGGDGMGRIVRLNTLASSRR